MPDQPSAGPAGPGSPPPRPARDLTDLLESIGSDGRLIHLERTPARPATHADWPTWADPALVTAYRNLGIARPWTHQTQAADALHAGHHTVISTGTGSGKSLAAWLPALSDALAAARTSATPEADGRRHTRISTYGHRPTTLYLSPTKALAADQAAALARLVDAIPAGAGGDHLAGLPTPLVRTGTCDGDTPLPERDWLRAHADVVLTNPDFLHFSLLPGHERWTRFLRALRYVVVDECHAYRGVLGAHVALVLRRLLRLTRRLDPQGRGPTVLCASATAAELALTAARLIGVEESRVVAVTHDAAPAGRRTLALWQPALVDPWDAAWAELESERPDDDADDGAALATADSPRRSAVVEASELLVDLLSVGARALCFVRSRRSAEVVAERTRHVLSLSQPALMDTVAAYRGGYLPEERRALERDLRRGRLRALATTNALELGIDVTGLDAVVIAGWPGTRVSLGQQAGRAGRAGAEGVAVLVASDDPLDAYLVHHPQDVFGAPEATVFDPANPYVLAPHLCAAAGESPLREEDLALFGLPDASFLGELERRGALRRRPSGWFWNTALPGRPQDLTSLRGDGPPDVPVVDAATGTVVGTVDGARADATVHEGAVYVHQGRTFVVEELTEEAAVVRERAAVGYRTRARSVSSVRIVAERERAEWDHGLTGDTAPPEAGTPQGAGTAGTPPGAAVTWSYGSVEVTSQVVGYHELALPGLEVVSQHELEMAEHVLPTAAVWWTVPAEVCEAAGLDARVLPGALHAAEHASIGLLPLLATCDRWDIGGLSTALHPQTMRPTVFVHDGHAGGAGFAERGWRAGRQWLEATLAVIEQCPCRSGCPSCVQSPKCGNNNEPLDKAGAATLLRLLLHAAPATWPAPAT